MKCPKCQGELHEMTVEGVALDFCSSCKGMWFDEDEMAFLTELPSDLPEPEVTRGAEATACTCPRCQTARLETMKFSQADALMIDRCPACHGMWLDKGELPKVEQIAAHRGDAKSKLILAIQQLKKQGYQIIGVHSK